MTFRLARAAAKRAPRAARHRTRHPASFSRERSVSKMPMPAGVALALS